MVKNLHILNGESTLSLFKQSNLEGDTFVWQEVLCEGPTQQNITTDEFWKERTEFMTKFFEITEEDFSEKVVTPFRKLEKEIDVYSEIILWFEYDLFCQINMIALLSWLKDLDLTGQISLICVGESEESENLIGLGQVPAEKYPELYDKRVKLNTRELTHAQDTWQTYCSQYPDDLYNFILLKMEEFQYLPAALECHLKRFPFSNNGLTEIENKAIELYQSGIHDDFKIVGQLLRWQSHYGFGDLQYFNTLEFLKSVLEINRGDDLEAYKSELTTHLNRDYKLGGANVSQWIWDTNEKALTPNESMP